MLDLTVAAPTRTPESGCPSWCTGIHPPAYHESAPVFTWEKAPGDVRTVTAVHFVDAVSDRMRSADWVVVKGGAAPVMFTVAESYKLAAIVGPGFPGFDRAQKQAVAFLAA